MKRAAIALSAAALLAPATIAALATGCHAQSPAETVSNEDLGGLARRNSRPIETHAGFETVYGSFTTSAGYKVRTIETAPPGQGRRLPGVLFVQWLSCDSVEIDPKDGSGWSGMIRGLVETPGIIVMRTEKPGIGDSEGPACETLDYDTELDVHRQALARLFKDPKVDPTKIFVIGMSMGSNMAPILASEQPMAGVAVWGGGAWPWLKRQVRFEQRAMELGGAAPADVKRKLPLISRFYELYLAKNENPARIESSEPELKGLWGKDLVGTEGQTHFGRPLAFHRQAQARDWAGAWKQIRVPVLVMLGTRDWYEDPRSATLAVDLVNANRPGLARLETFASLDHHFVSYPSDVAAFQQRDGTVDPSGPVRALRFFLAEVAKDR